VDVKKLLALGVAGAIAVGAWMWWTSDRRRLSARIDEMVELFEKSGPEDQLTAFGHTRQIVAMFAPGFVILARPYEGSIADRQQLAAVVQRYREGNTRIEIGDAERAISIDPERGTAETSAVFSLSGGRGVGGGVERFRARIAWVRLDGEWKIHEVEILEVLERGGLLGV